MIDIYKVLLVSFDRKWYYMRLNQGSLLSLCMPLWGPIDPFFIHEKETPEQLCFPPGVLNITP